MIEKNINQKENLISIGVEKKINRIEKKEDS